MCMQLYKPLCWLVHLFVCPLVHQLVADCLEHATYGGWSSFHSSSPITLSGWHIDHVSSHETPSEVQINSRCTWDSQISLCGSFDKYKGKVTTIKSPTQFFFHSCYPITLFGWHITHLSVHKPPSEAQINSPKIARFSSVNVLMTGLWIPNLQCSMSLFKTLTFQMMSWRTQFRW